MWTISPSVNEPLVVNSLMLSFGKALHLACEFERKCQYLLRILNLVEISESTGDIDKVFAVAEAAKDALLGQTIAGMQKTRYISPDEIELLTKARNGRNYIAHESGKIGPIDQLRAKDVANAFDALRPAVIDLARGDNLVSIWNLAIQEKQAAPKWMTQTYEGRVLSWIFGDAFSEPSSWDECTR